MKTGHSAAPPCLRPYRTVLATLFILLCHPLIEARPADDIQQFKSWFSRYKRGKIILYQKSPVPIQNGNGVNLQYFKTDAVQEMDGFFQALVDCNNLKATMLLADAAMFRFDRRGDVEARKYADRQPWLLRAHASDALARIKDPESIEWIRKNLMESRSLWDSAQRRALGCAVLSRRGDDPELLLSALSDSNDNVREEALLGLAEAGSYDQIDHVFDRLGDDSDIVRIAAVQAVGTILRNDRNTHPSFFGVCFGKIVPMLDDRSWSVKDAALTFLEKQRSVRAIPALIRFLKKIAAERDNFRMRTHYRTIEVLRSLTGVTHPGNDHTLWAKWWEENRKTFVLPPERAMRRGYQTGTAQFFSIAVNADRVLFILDTSGSMEAPLGRAPDPRSSDKVESKMDRARTELTRTLGDLQQRVRFNIIVFNDTVDRFSEGFLAATPGAVKNANAFFESSKPSGGTNLFDALNRALSIEDLGTLDRFGGKIDCDTIFLLSDGVPSTGLVIVPEEIVRIITKANRRCRIRIHTIYLGAEPSPFMQTLADRNFGEYVHVKQ